MNRKDQAQYDALVTSYGLLTRVVVLLDALHHLKSVTNDEPGNEGRIDEVVKMVLDVQAKLIGRDGGVVMGVLIRQKADLLKSLGCEKAW